MASSGERAGASPRLTWASPEVLKNAAERREPLRELGVEIHATVASCGEHGRKLNLEQAILNNINVHLSRTRN